MLLCIGFCTVCRAQSGSAYLPLTEGVWQSENKSISNLPDTLYYTRPASIEVKSEYTYAFTKNK